MRDDDAVRLRHMLDAARYALRFVQGRTRGDLDHDRQLVFALVKAIEIIGEAAYRTSPATPTTAIRLDPRGPALVPADGTRKALGPSSIPTPRRSLAVPSMRQPTKTSAQLGGGSGRTGDRVSC